MREHDHCRASAHAVAGNVTAPQSMCPAVLGTEVSFPSELTSLLPKTVATKLMLACGPSQPKPLLLRPAAAREACHPPPMRSLEHFTVLQSVGQFGNPAMIKAAVAPAARVLLACGVVLCGLRFTAHSEQAAEPLAVSE